MKPFAIRATKGERANPLRVKRLPANRKFRLLRIKPGVFRRQNGSCRCILAVPFFAFCDVELETVCSWQLPRRAGHRNTDFLISSPNVPVYLRGLEIEGTNRIKTAVLRVRSVRPP